MIAASLLFASVLATAGQPPLRSLLIKAAYVDGTAIRTGKLRLESATGTSETRDVPLAAQGTNVSLPLESRWFVSASVPGVWMPRRLLYVQEGTDASKLFVAWPTAVVSTRVRIAAAGKAAPKSVTIAANPMPGKRSELDEFSAVCPVNTGGMVRCDVPAALTDLVLRAQGFASVYRWDLHLRSGAPMDLGDSTLVEGASVAGWAKSDAGKLDGAMAEAWGISARGANPTVAKHLNRPLGQAAVGNRGFFQIVGLREGTYRILVRHKSFATASLTPVDVYRGAETLIRPVIKLSPPIALHLVVMPTKDASQKRWHFVVRHFEDIGGGGSGAPVFDGEADDVGAVEIARQSPGQFDVTILDHDGNPMLQEMMDVTGDGDSMRLFEVTSVHVTGLLLHGSDPASGSLWFGGRNGAVHAQATADQDGKFDVRLPRAGHWRVEIDAGGIQTSAVTDVIAKAGEASVTIVMSNAVVTGRVVADDGEGIAGAMVSLMGRESNLLARTLPDGRFSFSGAPKGKSALSATLGTTASVRHTDEVPIDVPEDGLIGPFELHLRASRHIVGTVSSARGPVAGALISVSSRPGGTTFYTPVTSDMDGSFEFDVPEGTAEAVAVVAPPGFAFRGFLIPTDGRTLVLTVPTEGGTLRLTFPESSGGAPKDVGVIQEQVTLPLVDLARWARSQGSLPRPGVIDIPNMSPGSYKACIAVNAGMKCSEGTLSAGGALELAFPRD